MFVSFTQQNQNSKHTILIHKVRIAYNVFEFRDCFRHFNVRQVLSMLKDDATFEVKTIFTWSSNNIYKCSIYRSSREIFLFCQTLPESSFGFYHLKKVVFKNQVPYQHSFKKVSFQAIQSFSVTQVNASCKKSGCHPLTWAPAAVCRSYIAPCVTCIFVCCSEDGDRP